MLQETKIGNRLPDGLFSIQDFKMYRKYVPARSGGLMMFVRGDVPRLRRTDLEPNSSQTDSGRIESLVVEITGKGEKWICCSMFKQPCIKLADLLTVMKSVINDAVQEGVNLIIVGDLNTNVMNENCDLQGLFETLELLILLKNLRCFKNKASPTIIDLIITNVPKRFKQILDIESELSDFHQMIYFSTTVHQEKSMPRHIMYISYTHFDKITVKPGN